MSENETGSLTAEDYEHQYGSLTPKQTSVVDVLAEGDYETDSEASDAAGVSQSYVSYVRENFDHIAEYRRDAMRYATDGSGDEYVDVRLTTDEAFKAIRMLPAELSQVVYQAVRSNQR